MPAASTCSGCRITAPFPARNPRAGTPGTCCLPSTQQFPEYFVILVSSGHESGKRRHRLIDLLNTKTMQQRHIAVFVGSLRDGSFNRKAAQAFIELDTSGYQYEIVEIGELSFYNEDLDGEPPAAWVQFRERIKRSDGVLFFTPEYNRSVPGVLKNALDVGSRPYGKNAWAGKPAGVISVSISAIGGFGANHHLRQTLVFLDMPCMQQPEAYIGNAGQLFDEAGALTEGSTRDFLANYRRQYEAWVELNLSKST